MILLACQALVVGMSWSVDPAKPDSPELELQLQVRPRLEKVFSGNIGARPGAPNFVITQRSRLGAGASWQGVSVHLSVQDVRTWAEEDHTLLDFSGNGIDFYEGWAQYEWETLRVRAGRQAIDLDGQRLVGAVDWTQQGRSFDGARIWYDPVEWVGLQAFYARVPDGGDHDLAILHTRVDAAGVRFASPVILQTNAGVPGLQRGPRVNDWTQVTAGAHISHAGDFHWRVEGYLQGAENRFAQLAAGRAGYRFNRWLNPEVWLDYVSGDSNLADQQQEAFDTLFGTNHKFYGLMDRFTNLPLHTGQGGLIDAAIKQTGEVGPGSLHAAVHLFAIPFTDINGRSGLRGVEIDAVYTWNLHKSLALQLGEGLFIDLGDYAQGPRTVRDWFYLQVSASL